MRHRAKIIRVIDGDTVEALVFSEKFFGVTLESQQILRLARINAPEVTGPEKKYGLQAEAGLSDMIDAVNGQGAFEVEAEETDSFGRYIAEIYLCTPDNGPKVNLSDWMVTVGFAEYKEY